MPAALTRIEPDARADERFTDQAAIDAEFAALVAAVWPVDPDVLAPTACRLLEPRRRQPRSAAAPRRLRGRSGRADRERRRSRGPPGLSRTVHQDEREVMSPIIDETATTGPVGDIARVIEDRYAPCMTWQNEVD